MDLLTKAFEISSDNQNELSSYVGNCVKFKKDILTPEFLRAHGNICIDTEFYIRETQRDHSGKLALRGYSGPTCFGKCISPDDIEIVDKITGSLTLGYADTEYVEADCQEFNLKAENLGRCPSGAPQMNIKFTGDADQLRRLNVAYCQGAEMSNEEIEADFTTNFEQEK